jgi:hypothetical protein
MRRAAAVSFVATALLAGAAPTAASPAPSEKLDPPTLLWKSFPLVQHKASQARTARAPAVPQAFAGQDSAGIAQSYLLVLTLLLLTAMLLAAAAVVATRTSAPPRVQARRGGLGRTRRRRRTVRAVATPAPRTTAPVTRARRAPPPLRVVAPRPIPPPPRPQTDPVGAKPEDDLTEAVPSPEAVPDVPLELELLQLVERIEAAPERERDELRKQVADVSARIDARPPTERELERRREHELRLLVDAVESGAETRFEPPPVPDVARAPRPAGEAVVACEIRLWRGFTRCQLYATSVTSDEAFALSGFFRLREGDAPNERALRALSDFLAKLARHGWTVVATGPTWYQHRLERPAPPPPPSL